MNDWLAQRPLAVWRFGTMALSRLRLSVSLAVILMALQRWSRDKHTTREMTRTFGINWHTLATAQWWRLITDVLIQGQPGLRWSILIPFLWVAVAEWHLGWWRTGTAFFVTDLVSTISTLVVLHIASAHSAWALQQATRFDSGSSAAIYGTLAMFCASRRGPNSWIAPTLLVQTMVTIWLTNHRLFDVQHLIAIGAGLFIGFVFFREPAATPVADDPRTEPVAVTSYSRLPTPSVSTRGAAGARRSASPVRPRR